MVRLCGYSEEDYRTSLLPAPPWANIRVQASLMPVAPPVTTARCPEKPWLESFKSVSCS